MTPLELITLTEPVVVPNFPSLATKIKLGSGERKSSSSLVQLRINKNASK